MGFDKNFAIFVADVAVIMLDIKKNWTGPPIFFIEINNNGTFLPSFTEVTIHIVGQILNIVEIK